MNFINSSMGDINIDPPIDIKETGASFLLGKWKGYQPHKGNTILLDNITEWINIHQFTNMDIKKENILIVPGASLGLSVCYSLVGSRDPGIAIPDFAFPLYKREIMYQGINRYEYNISSCDWNKTLSDIELSLKQGCKHILWNVPHNPTGKIAPLYVTEQLCNLANQYNSFIISDEVYSSFHHTNKVVSPYAIDPTRTIVISSFSKTFLMSGFRIGYIIANKDLIDELASRIWNRHMSTSFIAQDIANLFIEKYPHFGELLNGLTITNLSIAMKLLDAKKVRYIRPDGGIFILINVRDLGLDSVSFTKLFYKEKNVLVMSCSEFGDFGNDWIRINLCMNTETLKQMLRRLLYYFN
ncbi:pyridoxal phosphate-dependent aminotransferase [Bacillus sp. NPDC077027]|uniref:pyridoxal phosphate-dependent aminotransferase n=1 Tax=Bacillus sp. NPDC077027 TaxID=3390548 RepID=UPI003CFF3A69